MIKTNTNERMKFISFENKNKNTKMNNTIEKTVAAQLVFCSLSMSSGF